MKGKRQDGTTYNISCNIMRVVEISTLNPSTWEVLSKRVETKECDTPLSGEVERATGICRSCRKGWQTEGNVFASPEEKVRATASAEVVAK